MSEPPPDIVFVANLSPEHGGGRRCQGIVYPDSSAKARAEVPRQCRGAAIEGTDRCRQHPLDGAPPKPTPVRKEPAPRVQEPPAWFQGFAAAIASLVREHEQPALAREIIQDNGLTLGEFISAGVAPFDLAPVREAIRHG